MRLMAEKRKVVVDDERGVFIKRSENLVLLFQWTYHLLSICLIYFMLILHNSSMQNNKMIKLYNNQRKFIIILLHPDNIPKL